MGRSVPRWRNAGVQILNLYFRPLRWRSLCLTQLHHERDWIFVVQVLVTFRGFHG
jgi:hypothetical protein